MSLRFNPPPSWPQPPAGWHPPEGWQPDPSWPPLPPGWPLWVPAVAEPTLAFPVAAPAPATTNWPTPAPYPQQVPPQPYPQQQAPQPHPPVQPQAQTPAWPVPAAPAPATTTGEGKGPLFGRRRRQAEGEVERLTGELARVQAEAAALHRQLAEVQGQDAAGLVLATERLRAAYAEADDALEAKAELAAEQAARALADSHRQYEEVARRTADAEGQARQAEQRLGQLHQVVVRTEEAAMLQEAGIYEYRHPLADAVAYKAELDRLKDRVKDLAKGNGAVLAATGWQVNGSLAEGQKMVRDFSKLMLRAYNAEADSAVRSMRPHRLSSMTDRLEKTRQTIARLGTTMHIRISDDYHRLRVRELELTADHLAKQEEEKEQRRELRERQREEERLVKELERERSRLDKERRHYESALQRLRSGASADPAAVAELQEKLAEIEGEFAAVDAREANVRAGYVYVISNVGAFGERMVKIGMTRRLDPMDRVNELGDASVPFRFDVHALIFSEDAVGLERQLHQEFEDRRVNRVNLRREFFYVTPSEVRGALQRFAGQHLLEFREDPEAPEWQASRRTGQE
ncbi:DUF4041 domain-containing protein [Kitasatospora sp. NPDC051853]|uniref:DUF4041 domain-containing protein n=1 Tax=Kitasatospora sp. NPDC051853 TaxID=3364058 RepID=UPI0037B1BD0C